MLRQVPVLNLGRGVVGVHVECIKIFLGPEGVIWETTLIRISTSPCAMNGEVDVRVPLGDYKY